jgi:serine/threonine protein kinase
MEFLNGGSLDWHLNKQTVFTEKQAIFYSAQIFCGISYLHSKEIIHRYFSNL